MTMPPSSPAADRAPRVNAARLWAGGAATAAVAGLVAIVGILLARGVFDLEVLAPKGDGVWGDADTWTYAAVSAGAALVATGLRAGRAARSAADARSGAAPPRRPARRPVYG